MLLQLYLKANFCWHNQWPTYWIHLGEMIPKLKSRQPGAQGKAAGSQENPSTQGGGGGGGKKNKKKK